MTGSGTQQPGGERTPDDEAIEADPQPQPTPAVPEEDDPEIEETEEQPS